MQGQKSFKQVCHERELAEKRKSKEYAKRKALMSKELEVK